MMNSKEIAAQIFTADITANETASRFLEVVHGATRMAEDAREQLIDRIQYLAGELGRSLVALRKGETVNSLGICQGKATEIDRLCGELHVTSTIAGKAQHDAQRAGLLPQ